MHIMRRHYLDWLRVIVIAGLIPFHTAMTFAPYDWYIRNDRLSLAAQALVMLVDKYHMELLFLIAGAATWFSLEKRTPIEYLRERVLRLVVPLAFGMLLIVPPCYWVSARQFYLYRGTLLDYYPLFWRTSLLPWTRAFKPGGLWFLWYLCVYCFLLLPVFVLFKRSRTATWLKDLLASVFRKKGALLLMPMIPIALVQTYSTWAITSDFLVFYYVLFYAYGFFLFSTNHLDEWLDCNGPIALVVSIVTMCLFMSLVFPRWDTSYLGWGFFTRLGGTRGTTGFALFQLLASLCTWTSTVSLVYLARRFLNFRNAVLDYCNEVSFAWYIVHSTPVAVLGYYVIRWDLSVTFKYLINVVLAFIATWGVVALARATLPTRICLGMRPAGRKVVRS